MVKVLAVCPLVVSSGSVIVVGSGTSFVVVTSLHTTDRCLALVLGDVWLRWLGCSETVSAVSHNANPIHPTAGYSPYYMLPVLVVGWGGGVHVVIFHSISVLLSY